MMCPEKSLMPKAVMGREGLTLLLFLRITAEDPQDFSWRDSVWCKNRAQRQLGTLPGNGQSLLPMLKATRRAPLQGESGVCLVCV